MFNLFNRRDKMDLNAMSDVKSVLTNNVIESAIFSISSEIISKLAAHCSFIANLQKSGDFSQEALENANAKLISLIKALSPVMDLIKQKHPEVGPLIDLVENYSKL